MVAAFLSAASTASAQFAAPQALPGALSPSSVPSGAVTGDLNLDGRPDIVMPTAYGIDVYYSSQNGYGYPQQFGAQCAGNGTQAVSIADLDNDGYPDVVATCRIANAAGTTGALVFYWGAANQGFSATTSMPTFPSGNYPLAIGIGDFGGGRQDIVIARRDMGTSEGERVAYFVNGGNRTFTLVQDLDFYALGNVIVRDMVVADMNGDGGVEVVVASDRGIYIFNGPGNQLIGKITYPGPFIPWSITAGDFDHDGHMDVAVGMTDGRVDFWRFSGTSIGSATFWNGSTWTTGNGFQLLNYASMGSVSTHPVGSPSTGFTSGIPVHLAAADLNRDGWLDVVAINSSGSLPYGGTTPGTVTVALGGVGGFTEMAGSPISVGNVSPYAAAIDDFDGDGRLDILTTDGSGAKAPILLRNTFGMLLAAPASLTFWASAPQSGTISPAGIPVTVSSDPSTVGGNFLVTGNQLWLNTLPTSGGTGVQAPITINVDGSSLTPGVRKGQVTFAAPGLASGKVNVTVNVARPSGGLGSPALVYTPTDRPYRGMITGDFNGDGQMDFVLSGHTLLSNGAGGFTAIGNNIGYEGGEGRFAVTGDFNRDGKLDVAYTDGGSVITGLNNGTGAFTSGMTYHFLQQPANGYNSLTGLAVGDFNGDGFLDILASDGGSNPRFLVFYNRGDGTFGLPTTFAAPGGRFCSGCSRPQQVVAGDFNGDGHLDFMAVDQNYQFVTMLGNASGTGFTLTPDSLTNVSYGSSTGGVQQMVVADLNADGIDDVVIGYQANGTTRDLIRVLSGNSSIGTVGGGFGVGPIVGLEAASFGVGLQSLVVADVNGDGKPDVVEAHAQSTTFVVALGDGHGGIAGTRVYNTQYPIPGAYTGADYSAIGAGDINGDGKTDVVILQTAANCTPTCATTYVYAFTGVVSATTTTINGAGGTAQFGQAAPVTVTVTPAGFTAPTGNVSLKENGVVIASTQRTTPGTWTFTGISVGTHTVTAQYDGDESNALSTSATPVTFTITKATGSVAVTSNTNPADQGDPVTFTATLSPVSAGGTMTFKDGATTLGTATVNAAGVASFTTSSLAVGSRSIVAAFGGDNNVNAVVSPVFTQTIRASSRTLSLINLTQAYDGTAKTPTAITLPAGLHVDITFTNGACAAPGSPLAGAPVAVGTYCATATINDPNFQGNPSLSADFVITVGSATVSITNVSQSYDGQSRPVTVTTTPANLTYSITYGGNATAPSAIGTYPVVVTITDPNYTGGGTATLDIHATPATTTTVASSQNPSTFGTAPTFTAQVVSNGFALTGSVQFSVDGVVTASVPVIGGAAQWTPAAQLLRGGAHTVQAVYNADHADTENASSTGQLTQTVNKATTNVVLSNLSQIYTGAGLSATAATPAVPGLRVDLTYDGSPVLPVTAGTYGVVATINDQNYTGTTTGTLTIARATATAVYTGLVVGYDGLPHAIGVTTTPAVPVAVTYQPLVNGALTGAATATAPVNAGNYRVTVAGSNYVFPNADLTITKRGVSITLGNLSQVADGTPKSVSVVTNPAGITVTVKYTDGFNPATTTPPSIAPGPFDQWHWTVQASISDPNYAGSASATFDLHPKRATTTALVGPTTGTYGQSLLYTATVSANGYVPTGTVTFKDGNQVIRTVPVNTSGRAIAFGGFAPGTHGITATYNGDAEAIGSASPGVLNTVITKAVLPVTLVGANTFTYDKLSKPLKFSTPIATTLVVTYDGSTCVGTPSAAALAPPTNAKATPYVVKACVNDPNYDGFLQTTLTINKASATVALGSLTQTFNGSSKSASITTNPANVAVGVTYAGNAAAPSAAGSYPVVATVTDTNYTGSATGTLTIAAAAASITIGNTTQDYDGTPKNIAVTVTPALTYSVSYNGSAIAPTEAGTYPVTVTVTQAGYTGTATGTLTINGKLSLGFAPGNNGGSFLVDGQPVFATSITLAPGTHIVKADDLQTNFDSRYRFRLWSDGSKENPRTITIGGTGINRVSSISLKVFADYQRLITPIVRPAGAGTTSGPVWAASGDMMTFTATPASGFTVKQWSYDGTYTSNRTLSYPAQNSTESPVVEFVDAFTVRASASSADRGTVQAGPVPFDPNKRPAATIVLKAGSIFQTYATSAPGYLFDKWTVPFGVMPVDDNGAPIVEPFAYNAALRRLNQNFMSVVGDAPMVANFVKDEPNLVLSAGARSDACFALQGIGPCIYREQVMNFTNTGPGIARDISITGFKVSRVRVDLSALRATIAQVPLLGWTAPLSPQCYVDFETGADPCDLRTLRLKLLIAAPVSGPLGVYLFDTAAAIEIALLNPAPTMSTRLPVTFDRTIAPGETEGAIFGFNWRTITVKFAKIEFDYEVTFTYQASGQNKSATIWMR